MKKFKKMMQKSAVVVCALTVGATAVFAGGSEWLKADAVAESYIIGDSSYRGGTLWKATQAAYDLGMRL